MINKEILDKYVEDSSMFRKAIKDCTTWEELYILLSEIKAVGGYKLYVPNKWGIPVEDIAINSNTIWMYFYMIGQRRYKSIAGLSKVVQLISTGSRYDTFTLDYDGGQCNMKTEDAIKRLEKHKEWGFVEDTMEAIDCGIAALEKQIPKKPLEGDKKWYQCPECKGDLTHLRTMYCPYCGQKLKWKWVEHLEERENS